MPSCNGMHPTPIEVAFARFEARFQLVWVVGALIPAALPLSVQVGSAMVCVAAIAAGVVYAANLRSPGASGAAVRSRLAARQARRAAAGKRAADERASGGQKSG